MEIKYVKVPTGEVGYVWIERIVRGYRGWPSRTEVDVVYRSLETFRKRTRTFNIEEIRSVTEREYNDFISSDEYKAAYEQARLKSKKAAINARKG